MNNVKTFVLMAGLLGLFLLAGQLLGGAQAIEANAGAIVGALSAGEQRRAA